MILLYSNYEIFIIRIHIKHKKDNPPAEEDMNLENSANFAAYESGKTFFRTVYQSKPWTQNQNQKP